MLIDFGIGDTGLPILQYVEIWFFHHDDSLTYKVIKISRKESRRAREFRYILDTYIFIEIYFYTFIVKYKSEKYDPDCDDEKYIL